MYKLLVILLACVSINAIAEEISQQGRYQIVFGPHARADMYLLDTWTGKVWQNVKLVDMESEPNVWDIMDRVDGKKDYLEWINSHLSKKEAAALKKLPKEATP